MVTIFVNQLVIMANLIKDQKASPLLLRVMTPNMICFLVAVAPEVLVQVICDAVVDNAQFIIADPEGFHPQSFANHLRPITSTDNQ